MTTEYFIIHLVWMMGVNHRVLDVSYPPNVSVPLSADNVIANMA